MKIIGFIIFLSLASWLLVCWVIVPEAPLEIFLGMLAPLLVGIFTLILVERIYRREPAKLTSFMASAFLVKMVLYGVYVLLILGWYSFQPTPFIVSFSIYFVGLHMVEALYFRSLFNGGTCGMELREAE
jgi:hypothetical protein